MTDIFIVIGAVATAVIAILQAITFALLLPFVRLRGKDSKRRLLELKEQEQAIASLLQNDPELLQRVQKQRRLDRISRSLESSSPPRSPLRDHRRR